jgi:hypothetical protein
MDDAVDLEIRRGVVLPRVTSAPDAELFSTAEVCPTAALQELPDPVVPEPGRHRQAPLPTSAAWDVSHQTGSRGGRTGLALLGTLAAAAIIVVPLIVWSSQGRDHPAGSAARPGAGAVTPGTPSGPADSAATPHPTQTGVRGGKGASAKPGASGGAAHPKRFSLVAGPGCAGGAYARIGYYTEGTSGWLAGSDGYSGSGCDGRFDSLPMSGTTSGDDPTLYARWTFDPGSRHKCAVAVYTPKNSSKVYVGGSPAHYSVHLQSGNTPVTGFHIDQPHTLGRWVDGRSFTAKGAFYVRLDNTGKDWSGDTKTYAHVAAAQVRATCG